LLILPPLLFLYRTATRHVFASITPPLADGTYHITLSVTNAADLVTIVSSPFTVSVSPPDMTVMSPTPEGVDTTVKVSDTDVGLTHSTHSVGVNFNYQKPVGETNTLETIGK
jgi:hypothetical protein